MRPPAQAAALALLLSLPAGMATAAPVTFGFVFAPQAGTGSMTFDDPGDGTHQFFALTNVSALFMVEGTTFTLSDLDTPSNITSLVILESGPGTRTLVFSGSGDGKLGGALDFEVEETVLSFGSTSFAGLYSIDDAPGQSYTATAPLSATAIPLPGGLPLLAAGLAFFAALRRRAAA